MKRTFDISCALFGAIIFFVPMAILSVMIRLTSAGPALFWSERVGRDNKLFRMPKFRTMRIDTPLVATHALADPESHITALGSLLRRTSLDELPQLWSILKGDMSLVGPRPALPSQVDLIQLRTISGVERVRPGLTGWAQINGRDEIPIETKVRYDVQYIQNQSLLFDIKIIWRTFSKVLAREGISP
jgi:O-antigen biosynthesis protein WbqP